MNRRTLLKGLAAMGAASTATATIGAGGLAVRWWDEAAQGGRKVLSDTEHDFVQALAEAWMPAGGEPALSGADAQLGVYLDEVLAAMPAAASSPLQSLLQVLDDVPLLTWQSRFSRLTLADRQTVLRGWLASDNHLLRSGVSALLVLIGTGWLTHPQVVKMVQPEFGCMYGR